MVWRAQGSAGYEGIDIPFPFKLETYMICLYRSSYGNSTMLTGKMLRDGTTIISRDVEYNSFSIRMRLLR